jgi:hypothetical protein
MAIVSHDEQNERGIDIRWVALLISLLTSWRSLLLALSFLALSCLMVDHLLCPEKSPADVLKLRPQEEELVYG